MECKPNHIIMHVGTNEINTQRSPETIAAHIIKVCDGLKNSENDVSVSGSL